jgi:hypothetical protein
VAHFLRAAANYDPPAFEPKDAARQSWLDSHAALVGLPSISPGVVINVVLFLLVVIVWLALVPPGASRR